MSGSIERTKGQPGMSVKVPEKIISTEVTHEIAARMPHLGFEAQVEYQGDGSIPVVVFEDPKAKGVFTNLVNVAIDRRSPAEQILAVNKFVTKRVAE